MLKPKKKKKKKKKIPSSSESLNSNLDIDVLRLDFNSMGSIPLLKFVFPSNTDP